MMIRWPFASLSAPAGERIAYTHTPAYDTVATLSTRPGRGIRGSPGAQRGWGGWGGWAPASPGRLMASAGMPDRLLPVAAPARTAGQRACRASRAAAQASLSARPDKREKGYDDRYRKGRPVRRQHR